MQPAKRRDTKIYFCRHTSRPMAVVYNPETRQWMTVDLSKQKAYTTKKEAMASTE